MSITTFEATKQVLNRNSAEVKINNYSNNANDWVLFTLDEMKIKIEFRGGIFGNKTDLPEYIHIFNQLCREGTKFIWDKVLQVFIIDKQQFLYGVN